MIFNSRYIALATIISTLVQALPLDTSKPQDIVPRAKSYSVINVDGGSSTEAPADATTIVEGATKTVQVTNPGSTVTATVVVPAPAPIATSSSTSCTSSSTSRSSSSSTTTPTSTLTTTTQSSVMFTSVETPKPVFVTVTVTDDGGPTEYYDSGMWHTSYRIKSFKAVTATPLLPSLSTIASTSSSLPGW